jgi:hypothetical protein
MRKQPSPLQSQRGRAGGISQPGKWPGGIIPNRPHQSASLVTLHWPGRGAGPRCRRPPPMPTPRVARARFTAPSSAAARDVGAETGRCSGPGVYYSRRRRSAPPAPSHLLGPTIYSAFAIRSLKQKLVCVPFHTTTMTILLTLHHHHHMPFLSISSSRRL